MSNTVPLLVTCPRCEHTHTVLIGTGELMPNGPEERYYKLHELEKILSVSRPTLKRWIYTGKLTAVKLGGSDEGATPWYVSEGSLLAFRQRHNR
jgi:hypothetical protein